jgi:16S rRNA (guanine527-N7)-methyltransferase
MDTSIPPNDKHEETGFHDAREKLIEYIEMVKTAGEKLNLVSRDDLEHLKELHLAPSLAVLPLIKNEKKSILDMGSGAGFPGIPVGIMRENVDITLMEATKKKIRFLEKMIKELELSNIKTSWTRAEDFREKKFDIVMARSVAPMYKLQKLAAPLLKEGGILITWKGSRFLEEMEKVKKSLFQIEKVIEYDSPKKIVVLKKL